MRIDAHQHFWALERGDYGWLTPDLEQIYRDFGPEDLKPLLADQGIDGTILVQAAPTLAETRYMLSIAAQHNFVKGVVGWVDFEQPAAPDTIDDLSADAKLVGLRPMIQDIADDNWMLRRDLTPTFDALIDQDLTFDALTLPRHLPNLLRLMTTYPDMRVVIDHGSKPEIAAGKFDVWAADMSRLAAETDAFVKMSGLVTEAGADWSVAQLKPYVDHLLDRFGPSRVIWGSDWPVCTLASDYARWCRASDALLADLTPHDRADVLGLNAIRCYKIEGAAL